MKRIGKTSWYALFAGDPTFAMKVIETCESILTVRRKKDGIDLASSASGIMVCLKGAYQRVRREAVEDKILSPRMFTRESFVERKKELQTLDPEFFTEVSNACAKYSPESSLLVCGFDPEKKPHIFSVVNPGTIDSYNLTGFHAVGAGARTALARLLMLGAGKNDSIGVALYQVFDAKVNAELIQSVGTDWDAEILVPGKIKNVPPRIIRLIDNVYMAFPKDPFVRSRWKYPKRWKPRLQKWLRDALEDKPPRVSKAKKRIHP